MLSAWFSEYSAPKYEDECHLGGDCEQSLPFLRNTFERNELSYFPEHHTSSI